MDPHAFAPRESVKELPLYVCIHLLLKAFKNSESDIEVNNVTLITTLGALNRIVHSHSPGPESPLQATTTRF